MRRGLFYGRKTRGLQSVNLQMAQRDNCLTTHCAEEEADLVGSNRCPDRHQMLGEPRALSARSDGTPHGLDDQVSPP